MLSIVIMWQSPHSVHTVISMSWDVKVSHILRLWVQVAHTLSYKVLDACIKGSLIPNLVDTTLLRFNNVIHKILCNLNQWNVECRYIKHEVYICVHGYTINNAQNIYKINPNYEIGKKIFMFHRATHQEAAVNFGNQTWTYIGLHVISVV